MNQRALLYSMLIAVAFAILPSLRPEHPPLLSYASENPKAYLLSSERALSLWQKALAFLPLHPTEALALHDEEHRQQIEQRVEQLRQEGRVGDQCGGGDFQDRPPYTGPACQAEGCDENTNRWGGIPGCVSGRNQTFCSECQECSTDPTTGETTCITVTRCSTVPVCEEWSCQNICKGTLQHIHESSCGSFYWEVHDTYPANTAYLWDSQTETCGCGFPNTDACFQAPIPGPGGPGGGPGPSPGPIPTPCPSESEGTDTLKQYVLDTFNIDFRGPWNAGPLYDVCQKLYETSSTQFDDYFRSSSGTAVRLSGDASFCSVVGSVVTCGTGTGLNNGRGSFVTFNIFHELAHVLDFIVGFGESGRGGAATAHNADNGQTIWPHGHISIYPWDVMHGDNGCGSTWQPEEYADTVAYYLHPGLSQISPSCAGAPHPAVPYQDAPSPAHCAFMNDVLGPYNPFCAATLGQGGCHASVCDSDTPLGSCTSEVMLPVFGDHTCDAIQVCRGESGGNPWSLNDACLDGVSADYSVGLFQINLLDRCPQGIDWTGDFADPRCWIVNQAELDKCEEDFGLGDPVRNASKAATVASGGTNWCPWSVGDACVLCPHP